MVRAAASPLAVRPAARSPSRSRGRRVPSARNPSRPRCRTRARSRRTSPSRAPRTVGRTPGARSHRESRSPCTTNTAESAPTDDQSADRQLDGLRFDRLFTDRISRIVKARPQLDEFLAQARPGDTIHVHSIDRLARSLVHLLELVETIVERGISLHFWREGLTFDSNADSAMNRMQLQMLGAVAEFERSMIRERSREGVAVARRKGVKFGRPAALTATQVREVHKQRAAGKKIAALALDFDVGRGTIQRVLAAVPAPVRSGPSADGGSSFR